MNVCLRLVCTFVLVLALFMQGTGEARAASPISSPRTVALFLEDVQDAYASVLTAGLEQAKQRYGITYDIILSPDASRHEDDFARVSKAGYDLVLVPTIAFHTLLINNAGNFPKTRFAAINTRIKAPNIVSYTFADAEGAFLAGAAAALLTAQPESSGASTTASEQKIGWVGGADIPQSQGFLAGYRQGAKHIAPNVRVISMFTESFDDAEGGRTAATKLYGEGVRYIMHAGGHAGLGVIQAATQQQRHAIGLIANQDSLAPSVAFSLEKHVDKAVLAAVQSVCEGTFKGGDLVHLNLANGGFSLSQSPQLSPAITARLDQVSRDIQQKKITVDSGAGKGLCDCL